MRHGRLSREPVCDWRSSLDLAHLVLGISVAWDGMFRPPFGLR